MPTQRQINKAKARKDPYAAQAATLAAGEVARKRSAAGAEGKARRAVDAQMNAIDSARAVTPKKPKKPVTQGNGGGISGVFNRGTERKYLKNVDKYGGY